MLRFDLPNLVLEHCDPCVGVLRTARVELIDACGAEDGAQVVPGQPPELVDKKAAALLGDDRIGFATAARLERIGEIAAALATCGFSEDRFFLPLVQIHRRRGAARCASGAAESCPGVQERHRGGGAGAGTRSRAWFVVRIAATVSEPAAPPASAIVAATAPARAIVLVFITDFASVHCRARLARRAIPAKASSDDWTARRRAVRTIRVAR